MQKKLQPEIFDLECSTVWSFKRRGNWATHRSGYRGNWSPQVVRNLLMRYSKEGDIVLDPMVGGGTTLIECALTGRCGIGIDINPAAISITKEGLYFGDTEEAEKYNQAGGEQEIYIGDARDLTIIDDASVDFVLTHPPYSDIVKYSKGAIKGDLSNIHSVESFCDEIEKVAEELFRVLKTGGFCAVLIGDTRREKMYIPISAGVLQRFLCAGFHLKEDIIKLQHNCRATGFWVKKSKEYNFLLIMHEHLFIFVKK